MNLFPKIQSPCPYKSDFAQIMDGSTCRMCKREVHDLTAMTDDERFAFLDACEGEVCVSYSVMKPALAVLAAGAMVSALPAAAQQAPAPQAQPQAAPQQAPDPAAEDIWIMAGGMKKPRDAKWERHTPAPKAPTLPVVYEEPAKAKAPDAS